MYTSGDIITSDADRTTGNDVGVCNEDGSLGMKVLLAKCVIAFGLLWTPWSFATETAAQVFAQVSPSVVVVLSDGADGNPLALGSGVVVPGGAVVTNCHVVVNGSGTKVRYAGRTYAARLKVVDLERDVCSLSVAGLHAPPTTFGSTRALQVGATVYAIGAPEGLELSLSEGIVSSLRQDGAGRYIQTTAAISHGSSGGGLFDEQGHLLGLTSFYIKGGDQLNFALPVEWVETLPRRATQFQAWNNRVRGLGPDATVAFARDLVKTDPHNIIAWRYLYEAYKSLRKPEQAIDAAKRETVIGPQYENTWLDLAHAYNDSWPTATAESVDQVFADSDEAYKQALKVNPQDASVWDALANNYAGQIPSGVPSPYRTMAVDAAKQALAIEPNSAAAWHVLGSVYLELPDLPQATMALQHASRLDPKDEGVWYDLMVSHVDAGNPAGVIEAGRHVMQLDSDPVLGHEMPACYMAYAYMKLDDYDQALKMYRRVTAGAQGKGWANLCRDNYPTLEATLHSWAKRAGIAF